VAREVITFLRSGAEQEAMYRQPGLTFVILALAVSVLVVGFLLRWLSNVETPSDIARTVRDLLRDLQFWRRSRATETETDPHVGRQCPPLQFLDENCKAVSLEQFRGRIVVVKPCYSSRIDFYGTSYFPHAWDRVDDSRVVFLFVWEIRDPAALRKAGTEIFRWRHASSLALADPSGVLRHEFAMMSNDMLREFEPYSFSVVLDRDGRVQHVPRETFNYSEDDVKVVRKLLKEMSVSDSAA
jgi:hypothetical protein